METLSRYSSSPNGQHGLGRNLRPMVDEIDQFLKSAAGTGDHKFDAVRERLLDQVREMRSQLDELNDAAVARMKRAAAKTDQPVKAHPYGAMGIAAATGLPVGFLAAWRDWIARVGPMLLPLSLAARRCMDAPRGPSPAADQLRCPYLSFSSMHRMSRTRDNP